MEKIEFIAQHARTRNGMVWSVRHTRSSECTDALRCNYLAMTTIETRQDETNEV